MTKFNLHYGQARPVAFLDGKCIRMGHRSLALKSALQFAPENPSKRLNVEYKADKGTGTIEISEAWHVAHMFLLGWPIEGQDFAEATDRWPLIEVPALIVARRHVGSLGAAMKDALAVSLSVDTAQGNLDECLAQAIEDPWTIFGGNPTQWRTGISVRAANTMLIFPQHDMNEPGDVDPWLEALEPATKAALADMSRQFLTSEGTLYDGIYLATS